MKKAWIILVSLLLALLIGLLIVLGREPERGTSGASTQPASDMREPIRIGLVPERDIFSLRKRNRIMADYLESQLHRPVKLVTASSYGGILRDFQENRVDAAFLGSLVATLAIDRFNARVLLKTELPGGISSYRGVICVPEGSQIRTIGDLAGKDLAMVRTTTGGNLFPFYCLLQANMLAGEKRPRLVWLGTHDDAIRAMVRGDADAAAVKDLRLDAMRAADPQLKVRTLMASDAVPENALAVRGDLADSLGRELADTLLKMQTTPAGRAALQAYGATRFLPCDVQQYKVIYDIVEVLGPAWSQLEIDGPPPRRPAQAKQGGE